MLGVAGPEHMKALLARVREESQRMCDTSVAREDVRQILLIGITEKDLDNLNALAAADGRIKNYAVLVRRLIARAVREL